MNERTPQSEILVNEREMKIVQAQRRINHSIWRGLPPGARFAYQRLEAAAYAGAGVGSVGFIAKEIHLIEAAMPALSAQLQQELVDRTIQHMMALNMQAPDQNHVVQLFPLEPVVDDSEATPNAAESTVDVFSFIPERLLDITSGAVEQAREHVATAVVEPDKLAQIGLHPLQLYSTVTLSEASVMMVPTIIPAVSLRYRQPHGTKSRVVEFVMDSIV